MKIEGKQHAYAIEAESCSYIASQGFAQFIYRARQQTGIQASGLEPLQDA